MKRHTFRKMFSGTAPQLAEVLSATVSALAEEMQYAWSAPMALLLRGKNTPVTVTKSDERLIETLYLIGGLSAFPITVTLVEKIGRKYSILFAACVSLIGWIIMRAAIKPEMLLVAQFMTGLAGNVAFVACLMYVAEITEPQIRGFFGTFIFFMLLFGFILIYVIGPFVSLCVSSIIGAAFVVVQLITFPFMPESPYYLISKNCIDDAKKSLKRLRVKGNVSKEFDEIQSAIERQKQEQGRLQDLFLVKSNRKAITITAVVNVAPNFAGFTVLVMNLHSILEEAGSIYLEYKSAAIIFAVFMLSAACCASLTIDRFGRKKLLIISSILSGLAMLSLAVFFHLKFLDYDMVDFSWIPIASVMCFAIVYRIGLGVVPMILTSELFSSRFKAIGMTTTDAMYYFWAAVSVYIYQYMSDAFGMHVPFYIFSSSSIFASVFTIFYIPETKDKSLEEIQLMLKGASVPSEEVRDFPDRQNYTSSNTDNPNRI